MSCADKLRYPHMTSRNHGSPITERSTCAARRFDTRVSFSNRCHSHARKIADVLGLGHNTVAAVLGVSQKTIDRDLDSESDDSVPLAEPRSNTESDQSRVTNDSAPDSTTEHVCTVCGVSSGGSTVLPPATSRPFNCEREPGFFGMAASSSPARRSALTVRRG